MNKSLDPLSRLNALSESQQMLVTPHQALQIINGVAATPKSLAPDQWMALIIDKPDEATASELHALLETSRMLDDGIDGKPTHPQRIKALRGELARQNLDGFLIPRGDEHQGENVARHSERLTWLTGFTGSAGQAIVMTDKAAIFIDGRYTLQVKDQVDGNLFEYCHLSQQPATKWIADNLEEGQRLGYDAWLHTRSQVTRLKKASEKAGGKLVPIETNPVDSIWNNQPASPVSPVVAHDLKFTGQTSLEKRRIIARQMEKSGAGATLLSAPDSIAWLLNIRAGDVPSTPLTLSFVVIHSDGRVDLIIDPLKVLPETIDHLGEEVTIVPREQLGETLDQMGLSNQSVSLESATTPDWIYSRLEEAGANIITGTDPCQAPKAAKSAVEIEGSRAAHKRDGVSLSKFLCWLSETAPAGGVTEISAANKIDGLRHNNDLCTGLSFRTISGAGPNGAIVHYSVTESTNRELQPESLYLVDSGGQYLDGTTDVTRTVAIGQPTEEMRTHFTLVLKGHIALGSARFPKSTTGSQLDSLARQALWQHGLDYDHGTGHGVGSYLGVHEGPQRISKSPSTVALEPGMIVSNEPGYYKAGEYGIRIENLVHVTESVEYSTDQQTIYEFETLTLAPIDRNLIKVALLDEHEKHWLNSYHQRVYETIAPELDADTRKWLGQATRPI